MRILLLSFSFLMVLLNNDVSAQQFEPFYIRDFANVHQGKKVPYADVISYAGSFSGDVDNSKFIYVWVKTGVDEMGIRVLGAINNLPDGTLTEDNTVNSYLGKSFDPAVHFQAPQTPINSVQALRDAMNNSTEFASIFQNDNDETLLPQTNGQKLNAQIFPAASAPIIHGLFRIRVDNMNQEKGAFLLQIGNLIPGNVIIANDLPTLFNQVNN